MSIAGRYELISSDRYDEYLKECGVGMIQRGLAGKAHPVIEWKQENEKWKQMTNVTFKKFEITFIPGVEFDEELADGRKAKSVVTIEGNTLIHKQSIGSETSIVTRVFNGKEMITTFAKGNIVATRVFRKI